MLQFKPFRLSVSFPMLKHLGNAKFFSVEMPPTPSSVLRAIWPPSKKEREEESPPSCWRRRRNKQGDGSRKEEPDVMGSQKGKKRNWEKMCLDFYLKNTILCLREYVAKCEIRVGNHLVMTLDPRKRDESEIGWTFLFWGVPFSSLVRSAPASRKSNFFGARGGISGRARCVHKFRTRFLGRNWRRKNTKQEKKREKWFCNLITHFCTLVDRCFSELPVLRRDFLALPVPDVRCSLSLSVWQILLLFLSPLLSNYVRPLCSPPPQSPNINIITVKSTVV